jgi:hypothetical protein
MINIWKKPHCTYTGPPRYTTNQGHQLSLHRINTRQIPTRCFFIFTYRKIKPDHRPSSPETKGKGVDRASARDGAGLRRGARRPSPGPGPRAAAAEAGADDRPSGRPRIQCGPRLAARLPTPPPLPLLLRFAPRSSRLSRPRPPGAFLARTRSHHSAVRATTRHPPSPKASPVESESHSRRKSHGTASVRAATARKGRRRSPEEATP